MGQPAKAVKEHKRGGSVSTAEGESRAFDTVSPIDRCVQNARVMIEFQVSKIKKIKRAILARFNEDDMTVPIEKMGPRTGILRRTLLQGIPACVPGLGGGLHDQRLRGIGELDSFLREALEDLHVDRLLDIHIKVVIRT